MTASTLQKLKTIPQVAESLNLTYQGVYGLVTSGRLPAQLFAGRWFVDAEDLRQFKQDRENKRPRT